jgi:hypothetical protein
MTFRTTAALAAIVACAAGAHAEVYFGTYTPSITDPTIVSSTDPWPYELRPQDGPASATTQSDFESAYALINVFFTDFSRNTLYTEFVSPTSFEASHISLAVSRTFGATDTLMGLSVERWDDGAGAWVGLDNGFAGARIRAAGTPGGGGILDLSVPFGGNQTGSPTGFFSTPASIVAGERYRLVLSHSAGGQGGINWHLSQTPGQPGAAGLNGIPGDADLSSYYSGFDANAFVPFTGELDFQFAFAFTDGNPIPAPSAITLAALAGVAASRRRR